MITEIATIGHGSEALSYCERGGYLLQSSKCLGNANEISKQMKTVGRNNHRCEKKFFHVKIRIASEDKGKLTTQNWIDISENYALKMGFNNNMYATYMHQEATENEHIHIVVARVGENNLAVSDSYSHIKSMDFSRRIEEKYKLRKVKRKLEAIKKNEVFENDNSYVLDMKHIILSTLEKSKNFEEFKEKLGISDITVNTGRGIVFTNAKRIKRKGSAIDRKLSYQKILKVLDDNKIKHLQKLDLSKHNTKSINSNKVVKETPYQKEISR